MQEHLAEEATLQRMMGCGMTNMGGCIIFIFLCRKNFEGDYICKNRHKDFGIRDSAWKIITVV